MGTSEWFAFAGLIVAILIPAAMAIRRLGRIEANTEMHARQIVRLFDELADTRRAFVAHSKECDVDRSRTDERVSNNERRIISLETSWEG